MAKVRTVEVTRFVTDCVVAAGSPRKPAEQLADLLVSADKLGVRSHGLNRLERYIHDIMAGLCNPANSPKILNETASTAWVDGNNVLGATAANFCTELALKKARDTGVACISVKGSNHFGVGGYYAKKISDKGMLGIIFTNGSPLVAPTRGTEASLGTNPLTVVGPALPSTGPLYFDIATATVALGKLEMCRRKGIKLLPGWAQGPDGKETLDPDVAIKAGALMPLGGVEKTGGYKGFGLAAIVDMLSGILADPVTEEVNIETPTLDETPNPDNIPNPDNTPTLLETPNPDEIPEALLVALGNEKPKEERYGPNINHLIASRWETILLNDSEEIKDILNGYKVPQNCPLLDAPELNAEVKVALTESARNRDDMLRAKQRQLGIALTCLGQGMTKILTGQDVPDAMKMISDGTKLLASIHYKETNTRKQLLAPLLDKSFTKMAETIPRNQYLFGENLAEKIKNTKEIERSGLQLRKPKPPMFYRPGNWSGPSHQSSQKKNTIRGGQKRPQVQSQTKKTNQYQPLKKTVKRVPVNRPEREYQRARQRR